RGRHGARRQPAARDRRGRPPAQRPRPRRAADDRAARRARRVRPGAGGAAVRAPPADLRRHRLGDEARIRHRRRVADRRARAARMARDRRRDQAVVAGARLLRRPARRARGAGVPHAEVPHDGRGRGPPPGRARGAERGGWGAVQDPRRSARHLDRPRAPPPLARRGAQRDQRAARRDVPRRAEAAAVARLHAARAVASPPLQRPARRHGPLAGRGALRPDVRRSRAARLLLPRELVALARHHDPLQDAVRRPRAAGRLLSRAAAGRAGVAALLVAIAAAQWALVARTLDVDPFFDEGTYLLSVQALRHGFTLGKDVFASQPPLFYDLLRGLASVVAPTLRGLREATIATTLLAVPTLYVLGRSAAGRAAGVLAACLLAIAPPFPLYGARIFADVPALTLALAAVALAGVGAAEAAGAVLAAAVLVKLSAVTALPAVAALLLAARVPPRRLLFAVGAAAVVVAAVALAHLSGLHRIWSDAVAYHRHAPRSPDDLSNGHELRAYFNVRTPFLWLTLAGAAGALLGSWRVRAVWLWSLVGRLGRLAPVALACAALLVAAGYVQQVRNVDSNRTPLDQRLVTAARRVEAATRPGDFVVSDQPYVPVLAHRHVPPDLVDTANLRFASGFLTDERVRAAIVRYRVRVVVVGRSFRARPALLRWLRVSAASTSDVDGIRIFRLRR